MKEEEKIIKNTIKRTKEYDRTLSPYACKTSECQKLRKEVKKEMESTGIHLSEEEINSISNKEFKRRYNDRAFSWRGRNIIKRNMDIINEKSMK